MSGTQSPADAAQAQRRALLKFGAAAGLLTMLPPGLRVAARSFESSARAALGYWPAGAALADYRSVQAGWGSACAQSILACGTPRSDQLIDAKNLRGEPGNYVLRVIGGGMNCVLRLEADYGVAKHRLWHAWRDGDKLSFASSICVRWAAPERQGLALVSRFADGAQEQVQIPSLPGVYILALSEPAHRAPPWPQLALRAADKASPLNLRLEAPGGTVPAYVLMVVDRQPGAAEA